MCCMWLVFLCIVIYKISKAVRSIATGLIILGIIFILIFFTLTAFATMYKKRVKKIEENCDDNN